MVICFTSVEHQALATVFLWNNKGSNTNFGCGHRDQTFCKQLSEEPTIQTRVATEPCIKGQPSFKSFCAVALQEQKRSVISK